MTSPPEERRPSLWHSLRSGLFFIMAFCVCGGVVGLTVGVPLDKFLRPHAHGFPGLLGILLGVPVGALLGLGVGVWKVRGLEPKRREHLGGLALLAAAACASGLFLAVQTGLMRW
ncbi:hypothetical protein [Hyalangium rubrum]|uniref:Uncharacterized protein n=1 Tax=Hyalangium rubrum TaxID=3103134 RepID=A0ABU5GYX1_9BACT|nr:hypothetical protein [Hyalangium sp. s54d21]MDY7226401.1 hypothetical protein [Hyalangium sp. s54d21]